MRRSVLRCLGASAIAIVTAQGASAQLADGIADRVKSGVPVVGADIGATIPISGFRNSAQEGGGIAPFAGYQITVSTELVPGLTITPILQPQFAAFGTSTRGNTLASITSVTAGARFSLNDERSEVYFGAQGGYYWSTNGPREHDNGNGFNIEGGYNYDFLPGTGLGLFARLDQAVIRPFHESDGQTTQFITTGFEVRHRFLPPPPAPPPPVVAQAPPPPPPAVKKKIVLRGVNFDFNKYNIRPDAVPILDEAAKTLQEYGDIRVEVDGYTDAIGSDAYNEKLSLRRANAVKEYLVQHGVAASRLTVKGFGKSNPVASNATPEGRAQNRRVELLTNQ